MHIIILYPNNKNALSDLYSAPHKLDLGLINGWGHYNGMTGCFYEYLPVK